MSIAPGARIELPVTNDGALFTVNIEAGAPQRMRVPFGAVDALPLTLAVFDLDRQPVGRNIKVWISTDARRLPVKLQAELPIGNFVLNLREVK
jgi:hypothetical protein